MLLFNPQYGHIVNYDIRNLNVSRLDSDNGPLMVVDMNFPEFKGLSYTLQGPWRDSAGGSPNFLSGQASAEDAYPNDNVEYSTYYGPLGSQGVHQNTITTLKQYPISNTQSVFHTHHLGSYPAYTYRQYIGSGNYEIRNAAPQQAAWTVNNGKGDLSEFHRFYSGHIGDSNSWDYAEDNLFSAKLPYGAYFRSYPSTPINKMVDTEFVNRGRIAYVLETHDPLEFTGREFGRITRFSNSTNDYNTFTSNFGYTGTGTLCDVLDSDFLNVGPDDDWQIDNFSYARKLRIQDDGNQYRTSGNRKLLVLVSGGYDANTFQSQTYQDTILSCTLVSETSTTINCDSAQYHFNLRNHTGIDQTDSGVTQTFYRNIQSFDVSRDGKILTVVAGDFAGASYLLNFNMSTPWDLSTVDPWDWYDSGAAATGALGNYAPAGRTISPSIGRALNVPYREMYAAADSANTLLPDNIADAKGMYGIIDSSAVDFTHWNLKGNPQHRSGIGTDVQDICWNHDGSLLYVVGSTGGSVVQYNCGQLRDSSYHRNVGYSTTSDSAPTASQRLGFYGRP